MRFEFNPSQVIGNYMKQSPQRTLPEGDSPAEQALAIVQDDIDYAMDKVKRDFGPGQVIEVRGRDNKLSVDVADGSLAGKALDQLLGKTLDEADTPYVKRRLDVEA